MITPLLIAVLQFLCPGCSCKPTPLHQVHTPLATGTALAIRAYRNRALSFHSTGSSLRP